MDILKTKIPVKRTKKRDYSNYSSFIYRVLKQVSPDSGISSKAMDIMNAMVHDIFEKLSLEASRLAKYNKKQTITSREIQTAVRLVFPREIAKHAVSEGTKAVTKFNDSLGKSTGESKSRSERSGLQFPVGRIHKSLKKNGHTARVSQTAPVYLGAVLEYISAEVLELGAAAAKDNNKLRVNPRFILLAIRNDEELDALFAHVQISRGGVLPGINEAILPKKQRVKLAEVKAMENAAQTTY